MYNKADGNEPKDRRCLLTLGLNQFKLKKKTFRRQRIPEPSCKWKEIRNYQQRNPYHAKEYQYKE